MKAINSFSMNFLSRSSNESFARTAVAAFSAQLDPTLEEISDIKTAVSEAVTNCIVHAYKETIGKIYINCSITDNNLLKIQIKDKGLGIENIEQAMQPLFTTLGGERAGLGFAVMESFTDKIKVRSTVGKGTTVTLIKKINSKITVSGK